MSDIDVMLSSWVVGLLLIGLAVPLWKRKVGPNSAYGLRVAETLEDDEVWYEANVRSARDQMGVGVGLILVATALYFVEPLGPEAYALVCTGVLLVGVLWFCLHGIRIARRVKAEFARTRPSTGPDRSARDEGTFR